MTLTANDVVAEAREWIGTPYMHQQKTKGAGTDCIGLIIGLYQHFIGPIPKKAFLSYSPRWAEEGNPHIMTGVYAQYLEEVDLDYSPGQIITFALNDGAPVKHTAIITEQEQMIHAYSYHPVHESAISPWWRRRIRGCYQLPGMQPWQPSS